MSLDTAIKKLRTAPGNYGANLTMEEAESLLGHIREMTDALQRGHAARERRERSRSKED